MKTEATKNIDCLLTRVEHGCQILKWPDLWYYPVDKESQRQACLILRLKVNFAATWRTWYDPYLCWLALFEKEVMVTVYSIHYLTSLQHFALCRAILHHMLSILHMLIGCGTDGLLNGINLLCHPTVYESVEDYIQHTKMDHDAVWGTNVEILTLAHPVYCYDASQPQNIWVACFANGVDGWNSSIGIVSWLE